MLSSSSYYHGGSHTDSFSKNRFGAFSAQKPEKKESKRVGSQSASPSHLVGAGARNASQPYMSLVRAPVARPLHPAQIQKLLTHAGSNSDMLLLWKDHYARFDAGNYNAIFVKFTKLQPATKREREFENNGFAETLQAMVAGVISCLDNFYHIPRSQTIGALDQIKCKGQWLTRTFERLITQDEGAVLTNLADRTIRSIVDSYKYNGIKGLATEKFLVALTTELTVNRSADAETLSGVCATLSKIKLTSGPLKAAFQAAKAQIVEDGMALETVKAAGEFAHSLVMSLKDCTKELATLETVILTGEKGGCQLATWTKQEKFGMHLSEILHAFAKQGVGSKALYDAFETVLTDKVIATIPLHNLIDISWALVFAGRNKGEALTTMLGAVATAYETVDSDGVRAFDFISKEDSKKLSDEGKKQLEKLRWVKLSLQFESKVEFEWGELGDAIDAYKGQEPHGSKTQAAVFEEFQERYGKANVHWEYPVEKGLDVDIVIKREGNIQGVEVLGDDHYVDGANCEILNAQTKFRLRLLTAIMGADSVATISVKQWDRQRGPTLTAIQKQFG